MKDLKAIRGLHHLLELIDQGEHEHQDFKYLISDARKIARSISAFANNDGGRLLIGVKDNRQIAGVRSEEDLYMIEQAALLYCRPSIQVDFSAIKARQGAVVFIATIPKAEHRPVEVVEADGTLQAYYRIHDENITAHPLMAEAWRLAESAQGTLINTTHTEGIILEHMRSLPPDSPGTTHQDITRRCHLSHHTAAQAITKLAAIGLLQFTYHQHQFLITLPESKE
ncbi:MAG: ATP-binding protein [Clostridiales bacterium]|nr:ATP-binding protein [Clostridiales bacterium]